MDVEYIPCSTSKGERRDNWPFIGIILAAPSPSAWCLLCLWCARQGVYYVCDLCSAPSMPVQQFKNTGEKYALSYTTNYGHAHGISLSKNWQGDATKFHETSW